MLNDLLTNCMHLSVGNFGRYAVWYDPVILTSDASRDALVPEVDTTFISLE